VAAMFKKSSSLAAHFKFYVYWELKNEASRTKETC
jgi:hypothetical protein